MKKLLPFVVLVLMVALLAVPVSAAEDDGYNGYIDFLPVDSDWVTVPAGGYTDVYYYGDPAAGDYYCYILANTSGCIVSSRYQTASGLWEIDNFVCYRVKTNTRDSQFYIRFTNNSSSTVTFQIRRCFGGVLAGSVTLDASDFSYYDSGVDYSPSSVPFSSNFTQFPSTFTLYTETSQNSSYLRHFYIGCNSVNLAGLNSVTLRLAFETSSTCGLYNALGDIVSVEVFCDNGVIPCDLINVSGYDINAEDIHRTFFDVSFEPPADGNIVVRVSYSTASYKEYSGESLATVKTSLLVRDIVGRYENVYTLYDFYQQLSSDLAISFSELVDAMNLVNTHLTSINSMIANVYNQLNGFRTGFNTYADDMRAYMEILIDAESPEGEEAVQKSEEQAAQIQQSNDVLNSVDRVDVDSAVSNVNVNTSSDGLSSIFGAFLGIDLFVQMIMISLTVCLVAYVLFGKRS